MKTVGAYEMKTHLSRLLEEVEKGERIVITRHGRPVAELVPLPSRNTEKINKAIVDLKEFQKSHSLGEITVQELVREGRKG
ncbi:MAG: type II toxin-antitoxin system prevent-host-death family antitoxin [Nitrospirae bacterium]|nr:type II toxin-antitoxin system prevent-host-death family antitoxin [Nitrospirota bacterium]